MPLIFNTLDRARVQSFARTFASVAVGGLLALAAMTASAQISRLPPGDIVIPPRIPLPNPEDFVRITAGAHHTCATKEQRQHLLLGPEHARPGRHRQHRDVHRPSVRRPAAFRDAGQAGRRRP